jgi:hypothetical protein
MMCPASDNPASCEIRAVVRFLYAKSISAAEIRSELCGVYCQSAMTEGTARQWCRVFKNGRTDVHDEERSDLVQSADQIVCETWRFTISELSCEFPQISRTVLYKIISVRLGCYKFCTR